jgi:hypothetical protein
MGLAFMPAKWINGFGLVFAICNQRIMGNVGAMRKKITGTFYFLCALRRHLELVGSQEFDSQKYQRYQEQNWRPPMHGNKKKSVV